MAFLDNPITRVFHSILLGGILLAVVLFLLPTYEMPTALLASLDWLFDALWAFNFLIPVITLLTCVKIIILVDVLLLSFKFALFLKKHYTSTS